MVALSLLKCIVSRHIIGLILGLDNSVTDMHKSILRSRYYNSNLGQDTTTKYVFMAELHQRNVHLAHVTCSCRLVEGWTYLPACNEQYQDTW